MAPLGQEIFLLPACDLFLLSPFRQSDILAFSPDAILWEADGEDIFERVFPGDITTYRPGRTRVIFNRRMRSDDLKTNTEYVLGAHLLTLPLNRMGRSVAG